MRRSLAMLGAWAAVAVAACGGEEDDSAAIPADRAEAMITQLEQIESQSGNGACAGAEDKLDQLEQKVAELPQDVDPQVLEALADGVDRLRTLVAQECPENRPEQPEEPAPAPAPEPEAEPQPEEEPEEREQEEPEEKKEEKEEEKQDKEGGKENGGEDGGGSGGAPGPPGEQGRGVLPPAPGGEEG